MTVLVMQIVDYIKANDAPSLGVAGVSEAVAHAQNFFCECRTVGADGGVGLAAAETCPVPYVCSDGDVKHAHRFELQRFWCFFFPHATVRSTEVILASRVAPQVCGRSARQIPPSLVWSPLLPSMPSKTSSVPS